ncbi:MAG: hypothetical protein JSS83_26870 [Cyanobacteria bacterium SZAS LIN-3]|nr:hypothetical protein [Cyanobacteria bacterium SZAS LIN-3]
MKTLLDGFLHLLSHLRSATSGGAASSSPTVERLKFDHLSDIQKEAVQRYFGAVIDLVQLTKAIRGRQVAVDVESVLTAFEQAERNFIWIGMRPIFPPSVHCISSFDADKLIDKGLIDLLAEKEAPVLYSPAMRRHVGKLTALYRPRMLDSQSYNPKS